MQVLDEQDDRFGFDVFVLVSEIHSQLASPRRDGQRTDHADAIASIPCCVDRCLSDRSPSPTYDGLKHEARFVNEYNASLLLKALFLAAANRRGANALRRQRFVHAPVFPDVVG